MDSAMSEDFSAMKRIYIILGGIQSWDGPVTSAGMYTLQGMLKGQGEIKTSLWHNYQQTYLDIMDHQDDQIVVIGYSGGGAHATWIANGYYEVWRQGVTDRVYGKKPRIDLMVLYDPSPSWGMMHLKETNVKRCICYYNETPFMLGLGGGKAEGPTVEIVPIRMQHLAVQASMNLHRRTVEEVKKL
jgi:hypothetical protein